MAVKKKKTSYRSKPKIGYMDAIDFDHELGEALGGNTIYASKEDCLAHRKCADVCGMVRVKVFFDKQIIKENYAEMIKTAKKPSEIK